ncbi:hypothetical protein [Flavobacterium sp. 3HN19-14]|uniref:hypothetical protein n=1 Tax=Flavobacterium sp. 3HN19-14 TaxID=3448133 RepID=UPI003EE195E8
MVVAASIDLNTATFTWTPGQPTDTQWEMLFIASETPPATLPDNSTPPTVTGIMAPTYTATTLLQAQIYYVYVRTYCAATDQSVWVPFTKFNTKTCNTADKCNYKFVLTNTDGNTWNNGRMEVTQNGILIATLGANSVNGAPVSVGLCHNIPFKLTWTVAGTAPEEIGISVQNPFLDVIYTKPAGTGTPLTLLYTANTNCTPAPCSKPTGMTAVASATSAMLSWTDNATPPTALFDVYVVLTGGTPPTNDPATTPTFSGVPNPFNLTTFNGQPLTPSTSYTYYVRAVCSGTETSTWTILTPYTFITTPLNDNCANATPVTINPAQACLPANLAPGNTYGATAANFTVTPPLAGAGCGTQTSRDVWYSFVANSTSQTISLSDIVLAPGTPNTFKLNFAVFSGTCDNMTRLLCSNANVAGITNLTVGQTYYIRVYNATETANQSATFNLCIISPPANDECINAAPVTVSTAQTCDPATLVSGSTFGSTASLPVIAAPLANCGQTNNDVWYKFTALASSQTISISNVVPSPIGDNVRLNYTVFSGTCSNLTKLYCSNNYTSIATNLVPGDVYYIRVYTSNNNPLQSATFDLCVSSQPVNDNCLGALPVTVNTGQDCLPVNIVQGNTFGATASLPNPPVTGAGCGQTNNDLWYSFVAGSTQQTITLSSIVPSPATANFALNYTVFSGDCSGLTKLYCSTTNTSNATNLTIGNTYYIRVYIATNTADQSAEFQLCITSPPANDDCANAIDTLVNPTAECNLNSFGNTLGATASTPTITGTACTGTDDDVWFKFTATSGTIHHS